MQFQALIRRTPLALAVTSLALACACAPASDGASSSTSTAVDDGLFGPPLIVDGKEVTEAELKRFFVLGTWGNQLLESKKLQILIDEEVERRIAAGAPASDYDVADTDIDAAIAEANEQIAAEFPAGEIKSVDELAPMRKDVWRDQVKQTQLFDKVFLPENPNEYPPITEEALTEGGQGQQFVEKLKEGWEARQAMPVDERPDGQQRALFNTILRQMVMRHLNKTADVVEVQDGLPGDVAMRVNGKDITVEEIWSLISDRVKDQDVLEAKLWFAKTMAIRGELEKGGAYIDDETFEQLWQEHTGPYVDSPFNIPVIALGFKKFPSLSSYIDHYRLSESFKNMTADDFSDLNLEKHMTRANRLLGLARVDCEVILCSAYDFKAQVWRENGWEEASAKAKEVVRQLVEDERPWDEVLEENSDWWDQPVGKSQASMAAQVSNNKGRFGEKNRNELLQKMGESDYALFVFGRSVTDQVFFEMQAGEIGGPFAGPRGFYIVRVNSSRPPQKTLSLADENQRKLIEQDFLNVRFNAFGEAALSRANVQGLELSAARP